MSFRAHRRTRTSEFVRGWQTQPLSLSVLRAWLGVTFVYAGIQKFADPSFFQAGSPQSIGSQLQAFAQGSPIRPLLLLFDHIPLLTGIGIAVFEIGIGLATLVGVSLVVAASAGFCVNVVLWLSATWHVHPYFLGSDSIYAVAWLALLVGVLERQWRSDGVATAPPRTRSGLARRDLLRGGAVAVASVVLAAAAKAFAGAPLVAAHAGARALGQRRASSPTNGSNSAGPQATPSTSKTPVASVKGTRIASLDRLQVGEAVGFNDPLLGPAVLFRTSQDSVAAFSRICTHAGCEVGYDPTARLLVCPCHGAEFDPSRGARPIAGPAPTPLPSIKVLIDPASGDVILPS